MSKVFTIERLVRHGHTDPAGIVYYPRYYEMINDTVEDFFREVLGKPFGQMHLEDKKGIPLVKMETEFFAPSYADDVLLFSLSVTKLGKSSISFEITVACEGEARLIARQVVVYTDLQQMKSSEIDTALRAQISTYISPKT